MAGAPARTRGSADAVIVGLPGCLGLAAEALTLLDPHPQPIVRRGSLVGPVIFEPAASVMQHASPLRCFDAWRRYNTDMTNAAKRRWFSRPIRALSAWVLSRALRTEWDPDASSVMPEFEAIRRRKAELDRQLLQRCPPMTPAPKRRWSYHRWVQSMFVDDDDGIPRMQWNRSTMVLAVLLTILGIFTFLAVMCAPL
jgi:hypothetical protein